MGGGDGRRGVRERRQDEGRGSLDGKEKGGEGDEGKGRGARTLREGG